MKKLLQRLMILCCVLPWLAGCTTEPERRLAQCALERNKLLTMCHSNVAEKLTLKDTVNSLMEALKGLHEEHVDERREHMGVLSEHLAMIDAFRNLQEDHLILQKEYETLQHDSSGLEKGHENLQEDYRNLEKQVQTVLEGQRAFDKDYLRLEKDHKSLQKSHLRLGEDYRSLGKQYLSLSANYRSLKDDYGTVNDELHSLREQHTDIRKDRANVEQDHLRLQGLLQHSEESLRIVLQEKEGLSLALQEKEEENDNLKKELQMGAKVNEEIVKKIVRIKDDWNGIERVRRVQQESLLMENHEMKLKMKEENENCKKQLQNVKDIYSRNVRERDEKERFCESRLVTCQTEKEGLEEERDEKVYEMFEMKDKMMKDLRQLEKYNTEIGREKDAMQAFYESRINICLNERKTNEARTKEEIVKIVEIKDIAIETLHKVERDLTQVNREKEEMEEHYNRFLQRCLAEQKTMQRESKTELQKTLRREHSIANDLRKISENITRVQWEKDELERYYVNLAKDSLLEAERLERDEDSERFSEVASHKSQEDTGIVVEAEGETDEVESEQDMYENEMEQGEGEIVDEVEREEGEEYPNDEGMKEENELPHIPLLGSEEERYDIDTELDFLSNLDSLSKEIEGWLRELSGVEFDEEIEMRDLKEESDGSPVVEETGEEDEVLNDMIALEELGKELEDLSEKLKYLKTKEKVEDEQDGEIEKEEISSEHREVADSMTLEEDVEEKETHGEDEDPEEEISMNEEVKEVESEAEEAGDSELYEKIEDEVLNDMIALEELGKDLEDLSEKLKYLKTKEKVENEQDGEIEKEEISNEEREVADNMTLEEGDVEEKETHEEDEISMIEEVKEVESEAEEAGNSEL